MENNYEELVEQLEILKRKTQEIGVFLNDTKEQFNPTKINDNMCCLADMIIDVTNDFEIFCMMVCSGDHYKYFN